MKAFIVNRVGDLGFFIGIMILFMTFHTFNLDAIFAGIKRYFSANPPLAREMIVRK